MTGNPDPRTHAWRDDLADRRLKDTVSAPRYARGRAHRIKSPAANLHKAPDSSAMMVSQALKGEMFRVFDKRDEWVWGQLETDSYVGFLRAEHLTSDLTKPDHRLAVPRSFIYPRPDMKAPPLGWLSLNAAVSVTGREGDFAQLAGGGFVFSRHLAAMDETAPDFVAVAESFIAAPYLWGGRTSLGLDCSALVQMALLACGRPAPRDSDLQEAELFSPLPGSYGQARPRRGDLAFWPGHVAIVQDENRLLHANGHHMMVVSEPLDEAFARIERQDGPPRVIKRS
jgi:cell wall-associated NlpC family hydrolase